MLHDLITHQFLTHAFLAAIFSSILCGIVGTYIVSRRMVFISGGITHASFGGIGIAYFLGFHPLIGALVFSVLTGFSIEWLTKKVAMRNDSAIAMLWAFGMAIGIIFIYITPGYTPDLMNYLFGGILAVTTGELWAMALLTLFIIALFMLFSKQILFSAFDENFAKIMGYRVQLISYLMISLISLVIVLSIKVVGIILLLSLVTIPQNIAMIFSKQFYKIMVLSVIIALVGTIGGLIASYYLRIPSGATIIFILVILYVFLRLGMHFWTKSKTKRS